MEDATWSSQVNGKTHEVTESAPSAPMLYINEVLLCKPDNILVSLFRCPSIYSVFKAALHSSKNQNLKLAVLAHRLKIVSMKQEPRHTNSSQQDSFWEPTEHLLCDPAARGK